MINKPHGVQERIVAWDLETTGFVENPDARIIEIGAIVIDDGKITEEQTWMLNHNIDIPPVITEITGITKADIDKDGQDPEVCMKAFMELMNSADKNMTHNGYRFDIPFLTNSIARELPIDANTALQIKNHLIATMIDTAVMCKAKKLHMIPNHGESGEAFAQRVMNVRAKGVKYNVKLMCEELGIDLTGIDLHRALADVAMTIKIYQKLTEQK